LRRPPPSVDRSQDPRILQDVQSRLASEPALDASQIRVEVDGGVVLLYGSVAGMGAWNCALRNAQLVEGVRTVVDYLILERGPREAICVAHRGSTQNP
jgi:osmotically-inducible protein OsmY